MFYSVFKNKFQIKGFIPDKKIKKQTQCFYDLIEKRSPSDSRKTASLTKKAGLYEARLKISSASQFSFEISSKEQKASDSMKILHQKFLDKILDWNKKRGDSSKLLKQSINFKPFNQ